MPARPRRRVGRSRRNAAGSPSPGQRSFRPVRRPALRTGAAVGLSTCAPFSGDQKHRLVLPRVVVGLFGGREPSTRSQPSKCARWSPLRPWSGCWLAEDSPGAAVMRRALRTGAAVGRSTCAPSSGDQNQSFGLSESRRRLIWSVQTLDNAAMTANVRSTRPAPEASLAGNAGYASATCERFAAALVNPRQVRTRTTDAAATTGHISTVANVSRVLDHQMRRETTLGTPKRLVLAS
jgi:hypothetical protein